MNYYQRLRDLREDSDKTQAEIADVLQIQQSQYSRYELGKQMMGIDKYIALAKYYHVSLDYLTGLSDSPEGGVPSPRKIPEEKRAEQLAQKLNREICEAVQSAVAHTVKKYMHETIR